MSSFNSLQSTNQQALPSVADPVCPETSHPPNLSIHICFDSPSRKHLILSPFATDERISLITTTFSNRDGFEAVRRLCGDGAQADVDVIYEARSSLFSYAKRGSANSAFF
jgi:hypothetical protein